MNDEKIITEGCSRSVSVGFSYSSSGDIDPDAYRKALRGHVERMRQKLDELDGAGLVTDGEGI